MAAESAAIAAAGAAGVTAEASVAIGTAAYSAAMAGPAAASISSIGSAFLPCLIAFATSPAGVIIIVAAVLLALVGIIAWIVGSNHNVFAAEATKPATEGSTGFFSMTNGQGSNLAFLFSNRKAGYSSGVYMAFTPLTESAADLYGTLYAKKTLHYSSVDSSVASVSCGCDGPGGADAYCYFYLGDPTWGVG